MIARAATAQDDITGDGTTSIVLVVGELLRRASLLTVEGVAPRIICDGIDASKLFLLKALDQISVAAPTPDRALLEQVARSSLATKLQGGIAEMMVSIVVDAIQCIQKNQDVELDLHMIEIQHMLTQSDMHSRFIAGIVMDHGFRDPNMPKVVEDAYILTLNFSLEYEKTEVNSSFFYSDPKMRESLVMAERAHTDKRVQAIVDFKHRVVGDSGKGFVVFNHKGIDPLSLDMLCRNGIVALRRAKRRNMERLTKACGGECVNALEDLNESVLGHADRVAEVTLGEDKFTFVEGLKDPRSCTILIKGPNPHTISQIKQGVRDGLRAVRNILVDKKFVPGAGACELVLSRMLRDELVPKVSGRARLGVEAVAHALLIIPKTLAKNAGLDRQEAVIALEEAYEVAMAKPDATVASAALTCGLELASGKPIDPVALGVLDLYRVKHQMINSVTILAQQLLLVDEIMKAGRNLKSGG